MAILRKSLYRVSVIGQGPYSPLRLVDDRYETQEPDQARAVGEEMWSSYSSRHVFWTVITEKFNRFTPTPKEESK